MAQNCTTVALTDGREVLVSYQTPVAAFIPGRGYVRSAESWSRTTSKHVSQYCGKPGQGNTVVPDAEFLQLIAPMGGGRR